MVIEMTDVETLPTYADRPSYLRALCTNLMDGEVLEFGVWQGGSINYIADLLPNRVIYGFDSFEGLPEKWVRSKNDVYDVGHFKVNCLPSVRGNVVLVKGFFEDTLKKWKPDNNIALLHIDSDLYSSAMTVLSTLNPWIVKGTIIAFDELCDFKKTAYDFWREGEWRALHEWLSKYNRTILLLARTTTYQVAVKVL